MHNAAWRQAIDDAELRIDLVQLIKEVLDGAVGDQPMTELQKVDDACEAVERVLVEKVGRPINRSERTQLQIKTAAEFIARREQKKRDQAEANVTFASPSSAFSK
jgi:hypothetical protein